MGPSVLQKRLAEDENAFSGLLSLIPTRMHYADDDEPQSKKKAKKAKAKAAKAAQAALDAENAVTDDGERDDEQESASPGKEGNKRKLEDRDAEEADKHTTPAKNNTTIVEGTPGPKKKKLKVESPTDEKKVADQLLDEATREAKKARKAEKALKLQEKKAAKKAAAKEKKEKKGQEHPAATEDVEMTEPSTETTAENPQTNNDNTVPQVDNESSTSSEPHSPTFDSSDAISLSQQATQAEAASTTTSVSSAVPPSDKPKHIKIPEDTTAFRERFAARLAALRAARKADGPDGKPIRSRQELLEQRRQKQAQRKEHKKEMRKLARLEEERKREEALKANSPSVMSPGVDDFDEGNFSFGRVAFGDGSQLSHDLSYVLNRDHKKGPSDPKTALLRLQNQKKRLAELDEEKRKEIEEKETWLTARRRAEGEKIRDDEGLLKKAVKRKERTKRKSEKEWKERKQAVESGIKQRQKKREENIRKRKDEKKLGKLGKKKGGVKKKNRPGFEGRFAGAGKK